mmetsp:Transcript_2867/g.10384  ORF Transcript_2867/g.10384 Transcript_2867/m.10384 type:complete len:510 (-) Transcript_2867:201-1730(-)
METLGFRGVEVVATRQQGRHLKATARFGPGDVVLSEAPLAAVLYDHSIPERCEWCWRKRDEIEGSQLKICQQSKWARFCGRECQGHAWKAYYKRECEALKVLGKKRPPPTVRLAARLLEKMDQSDQARRAVEGLLSHWDEAGEQTKETYAHMALAALSFFLPGVELKQQEMGDGSHRTRSTAHLFGRMACNCHTTHDEEVRHVGIGLYTFAAMANHSSNPSCTQFFQGSRMHFRALRTIEPGDEVTIAYVEIAACYPELRHTLLTQYYFDTGPLPQELSRRELADAVMIVCKDKLAAGCESDKDLSLARVVVGGRDTECGLLYLGEPTGGGTEQRPEVRLWGMAEEDGTRACQSIGRALALFKQSKLVMDSGDYTGARSKLVAVEAYCDELCALTSGAVASLGPCHVLRLRLLESQLRCAIELHEWGVALDAAVKLEGPYSIAYPRIYPAVGVHYATLAKLWNFHENSKKAIKYARMAITNLQVTHGRGSRLLREVERILWEASAEASV